MTWSDMPPARRRWRSRRRASVRRDGTSSSRASRRDARASPCPLLAVNLPYDVFAETVEVAAERRLPEPTVCGLQLAELLHKRFPFDVVETETFHYELADEFVGEVRADPAEGLPTER